MFKFPVFQDKPYVNGSNITYVINSSDVIDNILSSSWNVTTFFSSTNVTTGNGNIDDVGFIVRNIKLLKAIVLCIVVMILILTMGKFVLKVFSSYIEGDRKDEEMVQHV